MNMFFYRLLKYVSFVADFSILIFLYYIYQAIKSFFKKQKWSFKEWIDEIGCELYGIAGKWSQIILIISSIALLVTNTTIHQFVGINNLELKPEGTYCFYVEATSNSGKNYTLPAQIRIEKESEEVGEGKERTYTYYYIEKVVFSNGGYLNTEDLESVKINEATYFYDNDDNEWELVLLNEHAYSPDIKETNNATWFDITFLSLEIISISILLYALFKNKKNPMFA